MCHHRGGHARRQHFRRAQDKAWARNDSALGVHTTRFKRVHDKNVRTTKEFCCDRDFSVSTDLDSEKKKKKRPPIFGVSHLGIRAKVYKLPGTQCLVQASQLGVSA